MQVYWNELDDWYNLEDWVDINKWDDIYDKRDQSFFWVLSKEYVLNCPNK